jgi:tripartite-type tricarboxylate transporter receptor subunit TctC
MRQALFGATLALASMFAAGGAIAQAWPAKPVRVIVPYAPGGTADTLGRVVADHMTEAFGQQFVIENRAGAGGVVGSQVTARSPADGYTLVVSGVGSHVVAPAINPNTQFDPMKDFTHIALFGGPPAVFVVNPKTGIENVAGLVAALNTPGRTLSYASPGAGTHGHLMAEFFLMKTGLKMEHIPYRGAGQAMGDLVAGHVPVGSTTFSTAATHIRTGALKPLAVTAPERLPTFPDIPTFAELGWPDLVGTVWFGLSGPAGLPADVVEKLNRETIRALSTPVAKERLARDAIATRPLTPAEFTRFVETEITVWGPVAKASGAQPE